MRTQGSYGTESERVGVHLTGEDLGGANSLATAVRKRLTGAAGIPAIFPLCAAGRQFSTAVLALAPPPCDPSTEECTPEEGKAFEGQLDDQRAFQVPSDGHTAPVVGKEGVRVGRMEVRRLTEEMGEGNEAVAGGLADW